MTFKNLFCLVVALVVVGLQAETLFIEAEDFDVVESGGWKIADCRSGSGLTALQGASGDPAGVARKVVTVKEGGLYRIWVRYQYANAFRGPFDLRVVANGESLAMHSFDIKAASNVRNWDCVWEYFDVDLPAGPVGLELGKHGQKNCSGYARLVDCVLLTTDLKLDTNGHGQQDLAHA